MDKNGAGKHYLLTTGLIVGVLLLLSLLGEASSPHDDGATLIGDDDHILYVLNNDPAGFTLTAVDSPQFGSAEQVGLAVRYTPPQGFVGEDSFSYRAENGLGDSIEAIVRLTVVEDSLGARIEQQAALDPKAAASYANALKKGYETDPDGQIARDLREAISIRAESDPWFKTRFGTALKASLTSRPIDLYVFIGDDNLQGITESGSYNGPGEAFTEELDRLWNGTPGEHNSSEILVLNCAVAGTVTPQWSDMGGPRTGLPDWLDNPHGTSLSVGCMEFIDSMLEDPSIPAVLRGLVIGLGANDARLASSEPDLAATWEQSLRQAIDLYRAAYGTRFGVVLVHLPDTVEDADWQTIREAQQDYAYYNTELVNTDGIATWNSAGEVPLFSDAGQQEFGQRLATAAHRLWQRSSPIYVGLHQQPPLGAVGECTRQSPCFPNSSYLIEPGVCDTPGFFRRDTESTRILCDQHGHSLHALASACDHCIDLEHVAGTLGVGLLKTRTGPRLETSYYMEQRIAGALVEPLPYQSPYSVGEPRPCGYQDRESSTFVLEPGSHDYLLRSQKAENCSTYDSSGCGLLLTPDTVTADEYESTLDITAGECREVAVQHSTGEQLSCGQEITADTILGHDLHCDFDEGIALFIRGEGITLDLNGYTLSATTDTSSDTQGLLIHESTTVTVTNGVIEGFATAVSIINDTTGVNLNRLTLRELTAEAEGHHVYGVNTFNGIRDVSIEDVLIEFIPKFHADGIGVDDTINIVARNTQQIGGASLFAVGPYECDHDAAPITFELHDSIVKAAWLSPVFAQCATSARVVGNELQALWSHAAGVTAHAGKPGYVKNLEFTNNFIHDAMIGLDFAGIDNSVVSSNIISDSSLWGVAMNYSLLCAHQEDPGSHPLPEWFECFGASGNTVRDNWVTSKAETIDLYAHPLSHDNTWQDNVCDSIEGENIPACIPEP